MKPLRRRVESATLSSRSASAKAAIQLRGSATARKARTTHRFELLNHLIRPPQHRLRDRQAEHFRGIEVNREFEPRRLLDG